MFDDLTKLQSQFDKDDMYTKIGGMAGDLEMGIDIGRKADLKELEGKVFDSIIVAGMGGSAIAGDIARNYIANELEVPFIVQRNYSLPAAGCICPARASFAGITSNRTNR